MSTAPQVFVGLVQDGHLRLDYRKQFDAYLTRFEGDEVEVQVRKRRSKRSSDQNAWLHAAFKGWGDFLGYPVDELKDEMLALVFGTHEVTSPVTGEIRRVLHESHTSKLNTGQFSELMDRAIVTAAETGYIVQFPDEYRARKRVAA